MTMPYVNWYQGKTKYNGKATSVHIFDVTLYFSYQTLVGISSPEGLYVRENDWSTTTGKHLAQLDVGKKDRLPSAKFEKKVDDILSKYEAIKLINEKLASAPAIAGGR